MVLNLKVELVCLGNCDEFQEPVHRDDPVIQPVVDCAVTQFDLCRTELLVKLASATEELNHTAHIERRCFHCETMRIVRRSDAQQKT